MLEFVSTCREKFSNHNPVKYLKMQLFAKIINGFTVFSGIPKKKTSLIVEIRVKVLLKLGGEVGMAERCRCGRFIYYGILSLL